MIFFENRSRRNLTGNTLPALLADFYKTSHRKQYKDGTKIVFANWIPRKSRIKGIDSVVCFGVQNFIVWYLIDYFNDNFFSRPLDEVIAEYERFMKFTLGVSVPTKKIIVRRNGMVCMSGNTEHSVECVNCQVHLKVNINTQRD